MGLPRRPFMDPTNPLLGLKGREAERDPSSTLHSLFSSVSMDEFLRQPQVLLLPSSELQDPGPPTLGQTRPFGRTPSSPEATRASGPRLRSLARKRDGAFPCRSSEARRWRGACEPCACRRASLTRVQTEVTGPFPEALEAEVQVLEDEQVAAGAELAEDHGGWRQPGGWWTPGGWAGGWAAGR